MCGILFVNKLDGSEAHKAIARRYRQQKDRGSRGYGYVAIDKDGTIKNVARAVDEEGIMKDLKDETSGAILFHHRQPTGGVANYIEVTHPFFISDKRFKYDYYIVHNGVISNWEALYEKYKKDGYVFLTEMHESSKVKFPNMKETEWEFDTKIKINDSEALSIDLARYFEGMSTDIESRGTIAFIALQVDKEKNKLVNVIYGHNDGNPLKVESDKTLFSLRSLGKGENVEDVPVNEINYLDWETKALTTEKQAIGSYFTSPHGGMGYDSKRVTRMNDATIEALRRKHNLPVRGPERMLDPTSPLLSLPPARTSDMNESLDDISAAYQRAVDNDDAHELSEQERLAYGGKDDERDSSLYSVHNLDNDDEPDYRQADFADELKQHNDLRDLSADLEIEEIMASLAENDSNSDEAVALRKELRKAIYDANGAASELADCKALLRSVVADFQVDKATIDECEEAQKMVSNAEQQHLAAMAEVNAVNDDLMSL